MVPLSELHVMPVADLIDHAANDACLCGPTVEPVMRPDGSNGWLHTHHSLDRREANDG
jgi:hypothetical protein